MALKSKENKTIHNRINYGILVLIMGFLFVFFLDAMTFLLLFALLILPFVSYRICKYQSENLSFSIEFEKNRINISDTAKLKITVVNDSVFPLSKTYFRMIFKNAFVDENKEIEMDVFVGAHKSKYIYYDISSEQGTKITACIVDYYLKDLLGMYKTKLIDCFCECDCLFLPNMEYVEGTTLIGNDEDNDESENREILGEDLSEIIDIRAFRPADKLSRIHWKLSTKLDEIMVKEFALEYGSDIEIGLEFARTENPNKLDKLMGGLYSFAYAMVMAGKEINVRYYDARFGELANIKINNVALLPEMMDKLFSVKLYENPRFLYNTLKDENKKFIYLDTINAFADIENKALCDLESGVRIAWV